MKNEKGLDSDWFKDNDEVEGADDDDGASTIDEQLDGSDRAGGRASSRLAAIRAIEIARERLALRRALEDFADY